MSRDRHSASTAAISHSVQPTSSMSVSQSRIPIKSKRAVLGERVENYDHATPRQHLVKPVKSVIRPRISSTKLKSAASPRKATNQPIPPRATSHGYSPASSIASSPAGANVSRPGHTPHPRRSSVGLGFLNNNDMSMLLDESRPDFLVSDTDESEADDEPSNNQMLARRGVMGPGRLMTPANSQDSQPNSQEHTLKEPSPRRLVMRLPTPPASQPGTDVEETLSRTLVRPRPAPTPPRQSAAPSIRLNGSIAAITQEISPNPRRKKSPRVDEAGPSRLRSPFELAPNSNTASPRHPRDRVEIVIGRSPRISTTPSTTPKATKGPRKARLSTKTPSSSHPLSQSTSSQPYRARKAPSTAPQANRRKSTPGVSRRQSTPQSSSYKVKYAKTPRLSVPARGRGRKSVTPAELKAMIGLLPEPVEQGSPSDDPLLLVGEDEDLFRKTPAVRPSSHTGKSTGSRSAARIIDFDAAIAQGSARSSDAQEIVRDYEVPLQGSEADHHDAPQDWGFDSGGDSDDEDIGNDTFLHVAGARSKSGTSLSMMAQPVADVEPVRKASPSRSRSNSPFLPISNTMQEARVSSPAPSVPAASPRGQSSQRLASPVTAADSPLVSTSAAMLSPAGPSHMVDSPKSARSRSTTPAGLQLELSHRSSPAPSLNHQDEEQHQSPAASSPRHSLRSHSATPRTHAVALEEDETSVTGDIDVTIRASPALSDKPSVGMLSTKSSPMSTRSRTATPLEDMTEQPSPVSTSRSESLAPFQEALDGEEPVHDSWSSGSPLRLPSTPSALGLFMAEEADDMSTPYSHAPEPENDTPTSAVASPTHSATPKLTSKDALPIVYTHSTRRSPICLPAEVEVHDTEEEGAEIEDKENQAPPPPQTTTPTFSPPTLRSTPPMYPLSFSPRIASPLRNTHMSTPNNLTNSTLYQSSQSPIPAVESLHSRFADEEEECTSGDVTVEGNSADWSLSDEGVEEDMDEVEEEELSFNSEKHTEDQDNTPERHTEPDPVLGEGMRQDDEAHGDFSVSGSALEEGEEEDDDETEVDDEERSVQEQIAESASHILDNALSEPQAIEQQEENLHQITEPAINEIAEEGLDKVDDLAAEESEREQEQASVAYLEAAVLEENREQSPEEEEEDEGEQADEEAASSDTLADDAGFESSQGDSAFAHEELDREEPDAPVQAPVPAPTPKPVVQEKVILKLVNRGIIKIEPEDVAPTSPVRLAAPILEIAAEERSTTPAYDPPQRLSRSTPVKMAPAASMYPDVPTTPIFAPLSPLPSTTPLDSPPTRQQAGPQPHSHAQAVNQSSILKAGPSSRPRSQLSRQVDSPDPVGDDEADKSIRVRSIRSLGDEFEDADNSMRSVVEVSSLDPKAAARAAAILKLNHAYIEHGDISKLGESAQTTSTRRRSMHSARLDKLDASRREDKTELLYEAELEIVSTRRSRSRSMSRFRGVSEAATELPLPGAWNGTPKRKRSALVHQPVEPVATTPTWGVSQWKKLEKVFRAEREVWVTERTVKAMPGGFIGWARMSTFGPPAATVKPWDPTRVVDRFLDEQAVPLDDQVGDWSRELVHTRVEALERHAEHRKVKDQAPKPVDHSPKKARIETRAKAVPAPPSTVRKLFGWVLPGSTPKASSATQGPAEVVIERSKQDKGKGKATVESQTFRDRLAAIQDQPEANMAQVLSDSVSRPTTFPIAPPHPSSPAWEAAGPSRLSTTFSATRDAQQSRPTPRTLSAILAESSSSTSTLGNSRLHSSLSQRSAALDALFSGSNSTNTAVKVPIIKKSSSVRDMVKSFEDSGAFDAAISGEGLRRVQSQNRPL